MEKDIEKKEKHPSPEELKKELEGCQKLANEYLTGWQRSKADFLNYKKGEAERMKEFLKYSNKELILKILPILDNFEKAEKEVRSTKYEEMKIEESIKGFLQIKIQLQDFLKNQGVEAIKIIGEKFDPNFHEAIEKVEVKDQEPGFVIAELQKGYLLHGKVIRPAKVKVSK